MVAEPWKKFQFADQTSFRPIQKLDERLLLDSLSHIFKYLQPKIQVVISRRRFNNYTEEVPKLQSLITISSSGNTATYLGIMVDL